MGIEHVEELTKLSTSNVQTWLNSKPVYNGSVVDLKLGEQIKLVTGDGRLGYASDGPYDAIHVGAAAPSIPQPVSECYKVVSLFCAVSSICKPFFNS